MEKRKIQEDRKILACQISAGKRERSPVCGYVCPGGAGLRVVGNAGILSDDFAELRQTLDLLYPIQLEAEGLISAPPVFDERRSRRLREVHTIEPAPHKNRATGLISSALQAFAG